MTLAIRNDSTDKVLVVFLQTELAKIEKNFQALCDSSLKDLNEHLRSSDTAVTTSTFFSQYKEKLHELEKEIQFGLESTGLSCLVMNLRNEQDLEQIKEWIKQGNTLKEALERAFEEKSKKIEESLPRELNLYLQNVHSKVLQALHEKQNFYDAQSGLYLKKVEQLHSFFIKLMQDFDLSLHDVYGDQCSILKKRKDLILDHGTNIVNRMNSVGKEKCNSLSEVMEETKRQVTKSLQEAMKILKASFVNKVINNKRGIKIDGELEAETIQILKDGCDIYLNTMETYSSLITQTVNQLIKTVQLEVNMLFLVQDKEILVFSEKTKVIKEFLEHEIRLILDKIRHFQKPQASEMLGKPGQRVFDETTLKVHGPIRKIAVNCGWWIDGLQLTYGNHTSIQHGRGGGTREFSLESDEKIIKIRLGTGIEAAHNWATNGIDSLEFFTNKGRSHGPFGCAHGKNPPQIKEISFGEEYYFSAVKGELSGETLHSISFIFQRDVASLVKQDLNSQVVKVLQLIQTHAEIDLSKEKEEIAVGLQSHDFSTNLYLSDPYQILGVSRGISLHELKQVRNKLLLSFHTDKLKAQEKYKESLYREKTQQIQRAYEQIERELTVDQKRQTTKDMLLNVEYKV